MVRKILRGTYRSLYRSYYRLYFVLFSSLNRKGTILFVDIDNTIADTWPTLVNKANVSESERLYGLKVISSIVTYINRHHEKPSVQRVYLTHRPYKHHRVTRKWLTFNGLLRPHDKLIMVDGVERKVWFFKKAVELYKEVIIFDDLSYHHELGLPKFYNKVIETINGMEVKYFGFHNLQKIKDDYGDS